MNPGAVYQVTSIGRPLEPEYPTNKAVLLLMPLAGIITAVVAGLRGSDLIGIASAGGLGVGTVFGAWALGRELAPDYNGAAFVAIALAFGTLFVVGSPSLLLLFATLFLVRVVNRSVGLAARLTDSIIVSLIVLWTVFSLDSPLLGMVAALAFAFDAVLRDPQRRQLVFAGFCIGAAGLWLSQHELQVLDLRTLDPSLLWVAGIVSLGFVVSIVRTRNIFSVGDATGEALSPSRVRAGMVIGLLAALPSLVLGPDGIETAALVWATLAAIPLGSFR